MNNLNSCLAEGILVRDAELKQTPKGTSVCNFTMASNRYYKGDSGFEKEVSFFEVETWGKLAEAVSQKGQKGSGVRVVGRLKQNRWVGVDGKVKSKIFVVAEHVEFRPKFKKTRDDLNDEDTLINEDTPSEPFSDVEDSVVDVDKDLSEQEAISF